MATSIWDRSGDTQIKASSFEPALGAFVDFFRGGTTSPISVFADSSESTSLGSRVSVIGNLARWPAIFVPTGDTYDYRIRDSDGTEITYFRNVPNPDPVTGDTPTPTALTTGQTTWMPQDAVLGGFVRLNGRTIGSTASAATERANDDALDLYTFLWNNCPDSTAPVSGGRGGSAAADFAANKVLQLLDVRGGGLLGLDTMGSTAGGFFASTPFTTGDAITVGSIAGYNSQNIAISEVEAHTHGTGTLITEQEGEHTHGPGTFTASSAGAHAHSTSEPPHSHPVSQYRQTGNANNGTGSVFGYVSSATTQDVTSGAVTTGLSISSAGAHTHSLTGTSDISSPTTHSHPISGATATNGGTDAYSVVQRSALGTFYIKL